MQSFPNVLLRLPWGHYSYTLSPVDAAICRHRPAALSQVSLCWRGAEYQTNAMLPAGAKVIERAIVCVGTPIHIHRCAYMHHPQAQADTRCTDTQTHTANSASCLYLRSLREGAKGWTSLLEKSSYSTFTEDYSNTSSFFEEISHMPLDFKICLTAVACSLALPLCKHRLKLV